MSADLINSNLLISNLFLFDMIKSYCIQITTSVERKHGHLEVENLRKLDSDWLTEAHVTKIAASYWSICPHTHPWSWLLVIT